MLDAHRFYDIWVARDEAGERFEENPPFVRHAHGYERGTRSGEKMCGAESEGCRLRGVECVMSEGEDTHIAYTYV
eukprot:38776-Eustigmatos_ZCMA.PRE.1